MCTGRARVTGRIPRTRVFTTRGNNHDATAHVQALLGAIVALVAGIGAAGAAADPGPSARPFARVIVLARHGNYTPDPKNDPEVGLTLNAIGVAQATLTGAHLAELGEHFDALYVSPTRRARHGGSDRARPAGQRDQG